MTGQQKLRYHSVVYLVVLKLAVLTSPLIVVVLHPAPADGAAVERRLEQGIVLDDGMVNGDCYFLLVCMAADFRVDEHRHAAYCGLHRRKIAQTLSHPHPPFLNAVSARDFVPPPGAQDVVLVSRLLVNYLAQRLKARLNGRFAAMYLEVTSSAARM